MMDAPQPPDFWSGLCAALVMTFALLVLLAALDGDET